ncbi:MAG: lysophospholipid acyltransferase family protein [Chloroflexi bacterium]|nr:lysophospholipid acyltransferase family protein [Chloroflexota bacterium]
MVRYVALWLAVKSGRWIPVRVLYAVAGAAARLAWATSPGLRSTTRDHMRHVLGLGAAKPAVDTAARGAVRSAALYYADLARYSHLDPAASFAEVESYEGLEHLFRAWDRGCGVVMVSAHLGNPEMIVQALGPFGIAPMVLTEPLAPRRLHDLVHGVRGHTGVSFVPVDRAGMRRAVAHIRAGGALAILADRDVLGSGRSTPFFGERAPLPHGAVELARRTGATLVVGFVYRRGVARYRIVIEPPLAIPRTGDRTADTVEGMRLLVKRLEGGIRAAPEQWFALTPVWNRIPR